MATGPPPPGTASRFMIARRRVLCPQHPWRRAPGECGPSPWPVSLPAWPCRLNALRLTSGRVEADPDSTLDRPMKV